MYGIPSKSSICRVVRDNVSYDVSIINIKTQKAISLKKSGTASGNVLRKKRALEHDLTLHGGDLNTLNFVSNMQTGDIPLYVTFTPIIPENEPVTAFYWEFGDGKTSDLMYPTHKYTKPGIYDVRLTVQINNNSQSYLYEDCVTVTNEVISLTNVDSIDSDEALVIHSLNTIGQMDTLNTIGQMDTTTVTAKKEIIIHSETVLKKGSEILLKIK